jgi:hypothetical protein
MQARMADNAFTRDPPKSKTCSKCNITKDISRFSKHPTASDGYRTQCKNCQFSRQSEHRRRTGYWRGDNGRKEQLKKKYKISIQQYEEMLASQRGVCALCGSADRKSKYGHFSIDHCHKTGRIRGLLCYRCNTILGVLGDDEESIWRVLLYVANPAS